MAWNGTDTLVAVGNSGVIFNSPNGTTDGWRPAAVNPAANTSVTLAGVTWDVDGAQFLAVGGGGSVLTSADGDTWVTQNSQVNIDLEAVVWTGSQFVAVGGSATILTSPDGITWTRQPAIPPVVTGTLRGVTASSSLVVAVGNNGAILNSPDGVGWTARPSGTSSSLEDAVWDGSQFVAAGAGDTHPDQRGWQRLDSQWPREQRCVLFRHDTLGILPVAGPAAGRRRIEWYHRDQFQHSQLDHTAVGHRQAAQRHHVAGRPDPDPYHHSGQ